MTIREELPLLPSIHVFNDNPCSDDWLVLWICDLSQITPLVLCPFVVEQRSRKDITPKYLGNHAKLTARSLFHILPR